MTRVPELLLEKGTYFYKKSKLLIKRFLLCGLALLALCSIVLFTGCTKETGDLTIKYDETTTIELSKNYEEVVWESEDTSIATVENSIVRGVGPGTTTITATSNEKVVAEYKISVEVIDISEIFLQSNKLNLKVGDTSKLTYQLFPKDASDYGLNYSSMNSEIATIDKDGNIIAVAPGSTNIVVSTESGVATSCEIVVEEPSAIEQLNDKELELFNYLTQSVFSRFYNAPEARIKNMLVMQNSDIYMIEIQGTNKFGGTLTKKYTCLVGTAFLEIVDESSIDELYVPLEKDVMDISKINAALEEYWKDNGMQ